MEVTVPPLSHQHYWPRSHIGVSLREGRTPCWWRQSWGLQAVRGSVSSDCHCLSFK